MGFMYTRKLMTYVYVALLTVLVETTRAELGQVRLYRDLMSNYSSYVKPTTDPSTQLEVQLAFSLARVESLDEKNQILTSFGWLTMGWKDELLQWDPEQYGSTQSLVLPASQVWLPELSMLNSVDQGSDLSMSTQTRVNVMSHGWVTWSPGFNWRTSCKVDLYYFPFDEQYCEVQFINWNYAFDKVHFINARPNVSMTFLTRNGEWEIRSTKTGQKNMSLNLWSQVTTVPVIGFRLHLVRRPGYLILNIVLPTLIMTYMSLLVFCLPAEAGEKLSLGITVLLSYTVVILMVSDITPRISDSLPIISIYLVLSMGLTALSLFGTVFVLSLHHHIPDKPLSQWTRTLVLRYMAYLLCMRRSRDVPEDDLPTVKSLTMVSEGNCKAKMGIRNSVNHYSITDFETDSLSEEEKEQFELNRAEWAAVARVIDRMFLVLYGGIIIMVIAVIFGLLGQQPLRTTSGYSDVDVHVIKD